MDLLEYQAKQLFQEVGIPILPSQTLSNPSQIKNLTLPYPIVLKSQVRVGGRGKLGGVRFAHNSIDAIAAAHTIFNLSILGEYPEVLLAEARYDSREELFLAIVLDYHLQKPVLMGSVQGGIEVDNILKNLSRVVIEKDFSPYMARQLATKMGLRGNTLNSVSEIITKMYRLFSTKDLEIIEINPLGIDENGQVMALDGKITVNDCAIARHLDLVNFCTTKQPLKWLRKTPPIGNVAIISNSNGLALAIWDELVQKEVQPAGCLLLDETKAHPEIGEQLVKGLEQILILPSVEVVLFNLVGNPPLMQFLIQTLAICLQPYLSLSTSSLGEDRLLRATRSRNSSPDPTSQATGQEVSFIFLCNTAIDKTQLKNEFGSWSIYWADSLDAALEQICELRNVDKIVS
jgi:succinyl-CoA synthetase beta subunit